MKEFIVSLKKWLSYKKAIELSNSRLFDVHTWSEYPEVNPVVAYVYNELSSNPAFTGNESIRKKHVKVLILDLYVVWLEDQTRYLSIYFRKAYYDCLESRYNKLFISKVTIVIAKALEAEGYITLHLGTYGREAGFKSRLTRIRATEKLIHLIVSNGVTAEMIERVPNIETIILRKYIPDEDKQINAAYNDDGDPRIIHWKNDLIAYNNLLRRTYIDVPSAPLDGIPCKQSDKSRRKGKRPRKVKVTQHEKFVHRVFNENWDNGGRFYGGWWQRIPEVWRAGIRIWNNPVTEVDYKGLHINLLYRLKNIPYTEDPYLLDGYEHTEDMRDLLKQVLLCSINAANRTKAIQAINMEINFNPEKYGWVREDEIDLGQLVDALATKHSSLEGDFFSGSGIRLQNFDSLIAEKIINHFTRQNIPVLCIHDSFVIQTDKAEELRTVMQDCFLEAFNELGLSSQLAPTTTFTGLDFGQFGVILRDPAWRELADSFYREQYDYPEWTRKLRRFREMTQASEFKPNYYHAENNFER